MLALVAAVQVERVLGPLRRAVEGVVVGHVPAEPGSVSGGGYDKRWDECPCVGQRVRIAQPMGSFMVICHQPMQHKPVYRAVHRQGKGKTERSIATPVSKGRQTSRHRFAACQGAHEPCTHSQKLSDSSRLTTSSSKKPSTASLNLSGAERGCVRRWAWQVFTPAWLEGGWKAQQLGE